MVVHYFSFFINFQEPKNKNKKKIKTEILFGYYVIISDSLFVKELKVRQKKKKKIYLKENFNFAAFSRNYSNIYIYIYIAYLPMIKYHSYSWNIMDLNPVI